MSKIDVSNCIVIFPKAVAFIRNHGYEVTTGNRKQCDIKLSHFLIENAMRKTSIPDVCIYDTKSKNWTVYFVNVSETLTFNGGKYNGKFTYYPLLLDEQHIDLLISFVRSYSGNTLDIVRTEVDHQSRFNSNQAALM